MTLFPNFENKKLCLKHVDPLTAHLESVGLYGTGTLWLNFVKKYVRNNVLFFSYRTFRTPISPMLLLSFT